MNACRLLIVLVVGLLSFTTNARAEHTIVLVGGGAPQVSRQVASVAIAAEIRAQGHQAVIPAFAAKEVTVATKCAAAAAKAWDCIEPTVRGKDLRRVAVVQVESAPAADGTTTIVVTVQVIVNGLDAVVGDKRYCARCTDDVLTNLSTELTRTLFHNIAVMGGRTVVAINSTPRGARVTFDGQLVGATDTAITTYPGPHTIALELEGFQGESRGVDAVEGATANVSIALTSTGTVDSGHHDIHQVVPIGPKIGDSHTGNHPVVFEPRSRLVPGLVIGLGATAVAGGVVALAFNQHAITDTSKISSAYYYNTTTPGWSLVAGGVVVDGIGGYLWWRYSGSVSAPTVAPVAGGAVVGVSGAF